MLHFIDISNWQKGLTLPEGNSLMPISNHIPLT